MDLSKIDDKIKKAIFDQVDKAFDQHEDKVLEKVDELLRILSGPRRSDAREHVKSAFRFAKAAVKAEDKKTSEVYIGAADDALRALRIVLAEETVIRSMKIENMVVDLVWSALSAIKNLAEGLIASTASGMVSGLVKGESGDASKSIFRRIFG